jgi:ABC-type enterochelin transport system ATPase subunit
MEIDKPFVIIINGMNVFSNYSQEIMNLEHTQIITPKGKLHYCKDGETEKTNTSFYSV